MLCLLTINSNSHKLIIALFMIAFLTQLLYAGLLLSWASSSLARFVLASLKQTIKCIMPYFYYRRAVVS